MAVMLAKSYVALKAAGVSDAAAQAAAEELADYEDRLANIEGKLTVLMMLFQAGVAVLGQAGPPRERPYSCRLYDDEQKKCAFGSCDARTVERLRRGVPARRRTPMTLDVRGRGPVIEASQALGGSRRS